MTLFFDWGDKSYSLKESKTITVTATIECQGRQYTFTRNLNVDPEVSVEEILSAYEEINYVRE